MKLQHLKQKASNLLFLKKSFLRMLEPDEDALNANIKYWLTNGELIQLKNGVYVLADAYKSEQDKGGYLEYLAVKMIEPAYLSCEYVLAKYQIMSEPVRVLTLVTTKSTRDVNSKIASFRYYSIAEKLFYGFTVKSFKDAPVYEASKSKALFDYLYFRFIKETPVNNIEIDNMRLNWDNISKKEFENAKEFLQFTDSARLREVFEIIKRKYYA